MDRAEREERIERHLRQLRVVIAGVLGSTSLLAGVVYFLTASGQMRPLAAGAATMQLVLVPLAVVLLGAAPALKRAHFKRAEAAGFGGDVERWLSAHCSAVILASALREGAAVLGLLLALLTTQPLWSYVFSALAVAAMLFDWPLASDLGE
jgi:hypothetical protein